MKHDDIRHKLSDYIDGAVTEMEKTEIEEHLKTCTKCSDALSELRKTIEQVKQVEDVEPPAWMTQKVMAKVREEAERRAGIWNKLLFPLRMRPAISAVAVLFLAVTAFYIYQNIRPEMKFAEAPLQTFEAKKEKPSAGAMQDKVGRVEEYRQQPKQAPQGPGYKALDMKLEYEKPAPPVPKEQAPQPAPATAPAPAKPEQPASRDVAARMKGFIAEREPMAEMQQEPGKAKDVGVQTMKQQAGRSMGPVAKEEAKPAAACLSYEPDVVFVHGIIREKDFPGPPNYESIARGDRRETSWILTLDKTVCVAGKGDALDEQEANVSEMQLVLDSNEYAKYRGLLMKPVVVRGTLFHAHTGHHRTRVLLTVLDIAERQ